MEAVTLLEMYRDHEGYDYTREVLHLALPPSGNQACKIEFYYIRPESRSGGTSEEADLLNSALAPALSQPTAAPWKQN